MRNALILLTLLLNPALVEATGQSHVCTFEMLRPDGYSKEITAMIQVQNRHIASVAVESTLVAPERGLVGASCEFESAENDEISLQPQNEEIVLKVAGDAPGKSVFIIKEIDEAYKIDLTRVSTSHCMPKGIWPRSVTISKGRKQCRIQN